MKSITEILSYDKTTGDFTWLESRGNIKKGSIAGYKDNGYIKIGANKKNYKAHILAWFFVYGEFPTKPIDHINHDRSDNRIENLREATLLENQRNASKSKANTSGTTGIHFHKRDEVWFATIRLEGKQKHLGNFTNKEDAITARKEAEIKYNFHENHGKELGLEG